MPKGFYRWLTVAAVWMCAFAASAAAEDPSNDVKADYGIIYTGRLFGYYRLPHVQDTKKPFCSFEPESGLPGPLEQAFQVQLAGLDQPGPKRAIRVATGDNFAPFFLAREINETTVGKKPPTEDNPDKLEWGPKQEFDWVPQAGSWIADDDFWHDDKLARHYPKSQFPDLVSQVDAARRSVVNGTSTIPTDNAACFLQWMQFDAIVPGIHDFYFGPRRLRELEQVLRKPGGTHGPKLESVRMLGANLYLKAIPGVENPAKTASPTPPSPVFTNRHTGAPLDPTQSTIRAALPKTVLPWMRRVRFQGVSTPGLGEVCLIDLPDPKKLSDLDCSVAGALLLVRVPSSAHSKQLKEGEYLFQLTSSSPLVQGKSYALVATAGDTKFAQAFTVQPSFFEYQGPEAKGEPNQPWVCVNREASVAIFGVVSQDLLQGVGTLNAGWIEADMDPGKPLKEDKEVQVQVADPAEALAQVVDYFSQNSACKDAHKILLAQMPQDSVYPMLRELNALDGSEPHFDLVVTEADSSHFTGDRTVTDNYPQAPVVLVPGPNFDQKDAYAVRSRVEMATVSETRLGSVIPDSPPPAPATRTVSNKFKVVPAPSAPGIPVDDELKTILGGNKPVWDLVNKELDLPPKERTLKPKSASHPSSAPSPDSVHPLSMERLTLEVMRQMCHSNAAFLQHRDIFFPPLGSFHIEDTHDPDKIDPNKLHVLVNLLLWKGDLVRCMNVSGDTINTLLTESQTFQDQEDQSLASDDTIGWPLASLGADATDQDPSKRLVNGQLLDPRALHSIAVTDFLWGGDTGYPVLKNAEPIPNRPFSELKFRSLNESIAAWILHGKTAEPISNLDALDPLSVPAPPKPVQGEAGFLDWAKHMFRFDQMKHLDCSGGQSLQNNFLNITPLCAEVNFQEKPTLTIDLYKLDASYSLFVHNGSEPSIGQNFPGVTSVDLSATDSKAFTLDYMTRIQYDMRPGAFYLQSEMNYGFREQRQSATNAYQPSQSADFWYQEFGWAQRLGPRHQNPSGWKLQIPGAFQTQPFDPLTQVSPIPLAGAPPAKGGGGAGPVPQQAARNRYISFRPGLRWDYVYPKPPSELMAPGSAAAQPAQPSQQSAGGQGNSKGGRGGGAQSGGAQGQGQGGQGATQTQTLNSYVEFGYTGGQVFDSPSLYTFTLTNNSTKPATSMTQACPVETLVSCLQQIGITVANSGTEATPTTPAVSPAISAALAQIQSNRSFFQQGIYFDTRFDLPVPFVPKAEFIAESTGEWFARRRSDTVVDTRFYVDQKLSLAVPLYGKLNIAPTVELIQFQTKPGAPGDAPVAHNYYHSYNTYVSLNYSFDWHTGLSWAKVAGFANPTPALPNLPTR